MRILQWTTAFVLATVLSGIAAEKTPAAKGKVIFTSATPDAVQNTTPLILAHRGGRAEFDDNALGGFKLALSRGIRGFETDVQLTKDGGIVIMHDGNVARTTSGKGNVANMTLAELTALKLKKSQENVPSYAELLAVFKGRKDIYVEFEMKPNANTKTQEGQEKFCTALYKMAKENMEPGTYTFTSFSTEHILTMKRLFPDAQIGQILGDILTKEQIDKAAKNKCFAMAPVAVKFDKARNRVTATTKEMVDYAHSKGMKVTTWMIESEDSWLRAKLVGADCTTSDNPYGVWQKALASGLADAEITVNRK